MIFHIVIWILHLLRVFYELTIWPAPRWLDSSVGRALHRYRRGHGFEFRSGLNFFQALISQLVTICVTAMIKHKFLFLRSSNIWSFIYLFTVWVCFAWKRTCREVHILIWIVSYEASVWHRGKRQLGNGLFYTVFEEYHYMFWFLSCPFDFGNDVLISKICPFDF